MTDPSHTKHELDQWLAAGMAALHAALDDLLDLDAGFADARLPRVQTGLTQALDDVLDLDAGLAQVLPRSPRAVSTPAPTPSGFLRGNSPQGTELGRFVDDLASRPPGDRLGIRSWFPARELGELRIITQLALRARDLDRIGRPRVRALGYALDLANARDLARDLANVLDRARDLANDLDRIGRPRVRALAYALDLADDLVDVLTDALVRVRDRTGDFASAGDLARARARARDRALALALTLARVHLDGLTFVYIRVRARARDLANDLANDLAGALAGDFASARDRDLASDLGPDFDVVCIGAHDREVFGLDLVAATDRLIEAVTNMTGADLAEVDLRGIPLQGLRWSNQTQWPVGWEEQIRRNSIELEPDLYEICNGNVDVDSAIKS